MQPSTSSHPSRLVSAPSQKLLIVGCGYLGMHVAAMAKRREFKVYGTTRSQFEKLRAAGIEPVGLDWNDARTMRDLPDVDCVLIAVSYDRNSRVDRFESQIGGLNRLIDALDRRDDRPKPDLCYISTTGVFHQTSGQWVDETSCTRPDREGGLAHLMAESTLRRRRGHEGWTVLRLAGIYGRNRVPRAADVIAGRPIASPEHGYLNLIHVEDAAAAVLATFEKRLSRRNLYLVGDDVPVVRRSFYEEIARQTGAPSPRFVEPAAEASARFRSETNKRVWNRRLKHDLLPKLKYPTHREGLADVLS